MKNAKETKEVKEDNKVEKIEETEKKSEANPLDEWFTEGKACYSNEFNIKYIFLTILTENFKPQTTTSLRWLNFRQFFHSCSRNPKECAKSLELGAVHKLCSLKIGNF